MVSDAKLERWKQAGILNAETAERIRRFEAGKERPVFLWAAVSIGVLAVALGIMLIVSANWDRIPGLVKLSVHALLLGFTGYVAWESARRGCLWVGEGALFLFSALVLAGIALQSQIFQLVGPTWQALLLWVFLSAPAMLLGGRTRLTGLVLSVGLLIALTSMAVDTASTTTPRLLAQGCAIAGPILLIALSGWQGQVAKGVRHTAAVVGFGTLLLGTSLAHFQWADDIGIFAAKDMLTRFIPAAILAVALSLFARPPFGTLHLSRRLLLVTILLPLAGAMAASVVPHSGDTVARAIGALIYAGIWALIAYVAAAEGRNLLFAVAVGAIAVRIFLIYIELFGSLAETGLMLLAGGVLLVALAWAWRTIVQRRWPHSGDKA